MSEQVQYLFVIFHLITFPYYFQGKLVGETFQELKKVLVIASKHQRPAEVSTYLPIP